MKRAVSIGTVISLALTGPAAPQALNPALQPVVCVSLQETRDLFLTTRLVSPSRVMQATSTASQAEALDIKLCRFNGVLVYDVTLLTRDGRVVHRLVNAQTGVMLGGHAKPPP